MKNHIIPAKKTMLGTMPLPFSSMNAPNHPIKNPPHETMPIVGRSHVTRRTPTNNSCLSKAIANRMNDNIKKIILGAKYTASLDKIYPYRKSKLAKKHVSACSRMSSLCSWFWDSGRKIQFRTKCKFQGINIKSLYRSFSFDS